MNYFADLVFSLNNFLWSGPLLFMLLGVGLYQTYKLKGLQLKKLFLAFNLMFYKLKLSASSSTSEKRLSGDIPSFQSLMTALAGSIGTGNITGVAAAITVGGLGSLFWMWIMAALGMATAYSETFLGVKYRRKNANGEMAGGPMYSLKYGLKSPKLAATYAIMAAIAAIGIGCLVQANSVVHAIVQISDQSRLFYGIILAILTGAVIIGGVKTIGKVASVLVPFMALIYVSACIIIIIYNVNFLGEALLIIIKSAFTGHAAVGGFLGSTVMLALQSGVKFGIFANEAGLGTLAIASSSAKTSEPVEQGLLSISGVFIATMIVCTLTGLVLAVTGVLGTEINGSLASGSPLAMLAFGKDFPVLKFVVVTGLLLFAFTTMIAWAYYGEKCCEFLFGVRIAFLYRWFFTFAVVIGAVMELELVWGIANLLSGLMAIPNMIAIVILSNVIATETESYFKEKHR
jgi:alanine or glycine:cation symporter, AGCS family